MVLAADAGRDWRELAGRLAAIVGRANVVSDADGLAVFDCDGFTGVRRRPPLAVLPETTEQIAEVLALCAREGVSVTPRGSGTSLSGGATALEHSIVLGLGKLNRILDVDAANRTVTVQPGVTNLAVSEAVKQHGLFYAPDPSSQIACSIGGNVAENAGGVRCLKYGVTAHHVLGVELVLMHGAVLRLGGAGFDLEGQDVLGAITGSEGLLGVVTEITLRLLASPPATETALIGFDSAEAASACVGDIVGAGVIPAGLEYMDLTVARAAEAFAGVGYPLDYQALLIVEVDGLASECGPLMNEIASHAERRGAGFIRRTADAADRARIWAGRKAAFPAMGRLAPDYYCVDGVIPRRALPEALAGVAALSARHGLTVANVFHAGDGNLHPIILYDRDAAGEMERAEALGADILSLCVSLGGVLSGEHGVGVEKRMLMPLMFSETDLGVQQRLKCAFDPDSLLNPGKVFPTLHRCAELGRMHVRAGAEPFANLPRF